MTGLTFAVASCQYPAGILDRRVANASLARLAQRIDNPATGPVPEFLLLVGDQVYVDATAGLFDPTTRYDRFQNTYERYLDRSGPLQDLVRRMPVYMMLDDHEIEDNWEPGNRIADPDSLMTEGRRAYLEFQRRAGPLQVEAEDDCPLWYTFERSGVPFFIADTRTEREARSAATVTQARIMSKRQFGALLDWLRRQDPDVPKFVASPAILLPRHLRAIQHGHAAGALRSDSWDGYPCSLHRILGYIATNRIRNVVFLSGDEHLSCIARATLTDRQSGHAVDIVSIHSSALHAPFPFANSIPEDFVVPDEFAFGLPTGRVDQGETGGDYQCAVQTEFAPPGDGFALISLAREEPGWTLCCDFDRARDGTAPEGARRFLTRFGR